MLQARVHSAWDLTKIGIMDLEKDNCLRNGIMTTIVSKVVLKEKELALPFLVPFSMESCCIHGLTE
jgi:hypothetical protein